MPTKRIFVSCIPIIIGLSLILLWLLPASLPARAFPASEQKTPVQPTETASRASISGSGLSFEKTVGLDPGTCATTNIISVTVGTTVYYCYTVTNNTAFTLSKHTLTDNILGTILSNFPYNLSPGASAFITQSAMISTTTINTATWEAVNPITAYTIITGTCTFPDISLTGTPLNLSDDGETNINAPFYFQFYDRISNLIRIGNNGGVVIGDADRNIPFTNSAIPTDTVPNFIAPFWDDLDDETGNVYAGWYTYTLAQTDSLLNPSGLEGSIAYYVVQWDELSHFPGPSASTATFALGMIKPGQSIDGYLIMCHADTEFGNPTYDYGASATIGINKDASSAVQFSYNTAHPELTTPFGMGFIPTGSGQAAADSDSAKVYVPPLSFEKTVGTDPGICATADTITVPIGTGTEATYCYKVRNTSAFTLSLHALEDSELGTLLENDSFILPPQATAFITQSVVLTSTTINTATWTATSPSDYTMITGTCTFPEISGTGTPLNLSDNGVADLTLPFDFPFYNLTTNQLTLSNDGVALLGPSGTTPPSPNEELPTSALPYALAPFWDDFDSKTGNVYAGWYTYTLASKPDNNLLIPSIDNPSGSTVYYVIQWDERSHTPGPGADTATFAIGLLKPGQGLDGYIFFCYQDTIFGDPGLDYGASATIGLNLNGLVADPFSYNTAHPELHVNGGIGFILNNNEITFTATDTATVLVKPYQIYLPVISRE